MANEPLIIHPPRVWLRVASVIMYLSLFIGGCWFSFDYGRSRAGFDSVNAQETISKLNLRQSQLERWNTELRERATILEGSREIDRQAYKQVENSLKDLQAEILNLRREVAFYKSVVSPNKAGAGKGLKVQSVKLDPIGRVGEYRYKLVLAQAAQTSKSLRGQIVLTIQGMQNGKEKRLSMSEFTNTKSALRFSFKNFQSLEGEIKLPKNFLPTKLTLRVTSDGNPSAQFDRTFTWQEVSI